MPRLLLRSWWNSALARKGSLAPPEAALLRRPLAARVTEAAQQGCHISGNAEQATKQQNRCLHRIHLVQLSSVVLVVL